MKTVKHTGLGFLILVTLFSSSAALAQQLESDEVVVKPDTEVLTQINTINNSLIQELRMQLSHNIKHQVNTALLHSAELIKNSLSQ